MFPNREPSITEDTLTIVHKIDVMLLISVLLDTFFFEKVSIQVICFSVYFSFFLTLVDP